MCFANHYLSGHLFTPLQISALPLPELSIVVTIPAINEANIIPTLEALKNCHQPTGTVEVIIHINDSDCSAETVVQQNNKSYNEVLAWIAEYSTPQKCFHLIRSQKLPRKHAGAGLARKIAMDEALNRFNLINKPTGIITGFDADALCTENYLVEIEKNFDSNTTGASINFEHPLSGTDFSDEIYFRIAQYELYLRYYNQALRHTGHPHAYHTIGSSFAVSAIAYAKQGGMNRRQAGEDFYFLQKIISLGNYTEINTTTVIPSPRPSDRVPFGTGAAISKLIVNKDYSYPTYNLQAFLDIKQLFKQTDTLYSSASCENTIPLLSLAPVLLQFLAENNFCQHLREIKQNSSTLPSFNKRFFQWFSIFRILKYLNYSHTTHYPEKPLSTMAGQLLQQIVPNTPKGTHAKQILLQYRTLEQQAYTQKQ